MVVILQRTYALRYYQNIFIFIETSGTKAGRKANNELIRASYARGPP